MKKLLDAKKTICLFMICLMLVVCADAVFAMDDTNQTDLELADEDTELSSQANSYYFNASAENDDGDGSAENPYKYLTSSRIKSECDIYLADGEYELDTTVTIFNVNIYGSNANKTIIKYDGTGFNVRNILRVSNLTLDGASIYNNNMFTATNANFMNGHGSRDADKTQFENYFGGAIHSSNKNMNTKLTLINCTFTDNTADYGGAVYVSNGYLTAENCRFANNLATNFGGAIAAEGATSLTISKSGFEKNNSTEGSGGALYVKKSEILNITDCVFADSNARFGGAIVSLNTATVITNSTFERNSARYYGGAVFHMYSNFTSQDSTYKSNHALNGAGLYLDHVNMTSLKGNVFTENTASNLGGAIYGILNNFTEEMNNTFTDNDVCNICELDLDIGRGDYEIYQIEEVNITELPSYYSMLDENLLTPVKDQMDSGNCWAFAVMAVLESCLKKITGMDFDFSEENAKNLMSLYSDYGTVYDTNEGAHSSTAISYLTSWLGPIYDLEDVFDDKTALSRIFNSTMHVQNVLFLKRNNATDNDAIKRAILEYGAVGTSMYYVSKYLKDNLNYNSATTQTANHAAVIVGWDDNYSKSNFYGYPEGDGAWIVRSSWGDEWADHGYCYVSYYDANFARVGETTKTYTIILNDTVKFDKNYQYDIAGPNTYLKANTASIAYKNRFTSTENEVLTGVSTYFNRQYNWTLTVHVNDIVKAFKTGTSPAGYWTIPLDEIPLYAGDVFEVTFNLTSDTVASVPITQAKTINTVTFKENISFINWDGTWKDLYKLNNKDFPSQVASIKAFTIARTPYTVTGLTVNYIGHNQINVTANVIDQYMNPAKGNVTFNVNGMTVEMALENGTTSLIYNLSSTLAYISAEYSGIGYEPSEDFTIYEITPKDINITLNITISDLNNVLLEITSSEEINETLTILVNDVQANVEFTNNTATYYMSKLKNGDYILNIHLNNTMAYNANNITDNFDVDKYIISIDMTYTDHNHINVSANVFDDYSNPAEGNVTLKLDDIIKVMELNNGTASFIHVINNNSINIAAEYTSQKNNTFTNLTTFEITPKDISMTLKITVSDLNNVLLEITSGEEINETLTITVNDLELNVEFTNKTASYYMSGLKNGDYALDIHLNNTLAYKCERITDRFTIAKYNVKITGNKDIMMYYGAGKTYKVRVYGEDGNPLTGGSVTIKIGKKKVTVKIDSKGYASYKITQKVGKYTITCEYKGVKVSNKVTVKTTLITKNKKVKKSKTVKFKAKLLNSKGKALKGKKITFKVKSKKYKVKTNKKGIAVLKLKNLKVGKHKVITSYKKLKNTNKITVKR